MPPNPFEMLKICVYLNLVTDNSVHNIKERQKYQMFATNENKYLLN